MVKELPSFIVQYVNFLENEGRRPSTLQQYSSDLSTFYSWIIKNGGEEKDVNILESLNEDHYKKFFSYLKNRNFAAATIRRYATVLNKLLSFYDLPSKIDVHALSGADNQRELTPGDFISNREFKRLVSSMSTKVNALETNLTARDYLIDRNLALVLLIREYGLSSTQLSEINMNNINFAQNELIINSIPGVKFPLTPKQKKHLYSYYQSIPKNVRPVFHSGEPLFVAFNNKSMSFQYDYASGHPKRLSARAIREILKEEVIRAGLRRLSSKHLRNSSILSRIKDGMSDEDIGKFYSLSPSSSQLYYSLKRYKSFLLTEESENVL